MTVQNKYVGDVGDFGKYGLLRYLCSDVEASGFLPSLGVIWYLVPDEAHSRDGGFIGYLKPTETNEERFKACDPLLYDALQRIVDNKSRSVANIRRDGVLPNETRFFQDVLTFEVLRGGIEIRHRRVARRAEWFQRALSATESCDIVFLDPDNGLEVGVGPHQLKGIKYASYDELTSLAQRDQSLVVYHHLARRATAEAQIRDRLFQLQSLLGREAFALRYRRGSARAFFVVPAPRHWEFLSQRASGFLETRWSRHFEMVDST